MEVSYVSALDSLTSQLKLVVDLCIKLLNNSLPKLEDDAQHQASLMPVLQTIDSQGLMFEQILSSLEKQLGVREQIFARALTKTQTEQDRMKREINFLERQLVSLPPEKSAFKQNKSGASSRASSSGSQVTELTELKEKLRRQVTELQQLTSISSNKPSVKVPPLPVKRSPRDSESSDSEFHPLDTLIFRRTIPNRN